jgi:integrase
MIGFFMEQINQSSVSTSASPSRIGYWATHEYHRRKCSSKEGEPVDFTGFCGWKRLQQIASDLDETTRDLFLSLFFCGSRANEILLAKGKNFKVGEETIRVIGLPAFKKIRGKRFQSGEWRFRHFPIYRREPLIDFFERFILSKGEEDKLFDFKYGTLYRLICGIAKEWFPHKLRAERASQLVEDYGANTFQLKAFFNWSRDETPNFYVKLGMKGIEQMYGIRTPEPLILSKNEEVSSVVEPLPPPEEEDRDKLLFLGKKSQV